MRWTDEARRRQSELIRNWRPWERSTGPTSQEGKAIASKNRYRGNVRQTLRELARSLRKCANEC